jgi:hypothetical protein
MEEAHAPDGGWPSDLEPSTSELLWCQEPLEALDAWSRNDTSDYYARAEGWQDWSEATMEAWMAERKARPPSPPSLRCACSPVRVRLCPYGSSNAPRLIAWPTAPLGACCSSVLLRPASEASALTALLSAGRSARTPSTAGSSSRPSTSTPAAAASRPATRRPPQESRPPAPRRDPHRLGGARQVTAAWPSPCTKPTPPTRRRRAPRPARRRAATPRDGRTAGRGRCGTSTSLKTVHVPRPRARTCTRPPPPPPA